MKTIEMRNDRGLITGFRVRDVFLSRLAIPKIVLSIPGARANRKHRLFQTNRDDFCEFEVDGRTFLVIEPFGENTEFCVVQEPPIGDTPELRKVRQAFESRRVLFGPIEYLKPAGFDAPRWLSPATSRHWRSKIGRHLAAVRNAR
jgi:hypothetical protein